MNSDPIERLETATGPCRELDFILMTIQHDWKRRKLSPMATTRDWAWVDRQTNRWRTTARQGFTFTASIDAALTLVPEGAYPLISKIAPERWRVHLGFANRAVGASATAPTPALALCIAALKARGGR